MADNSDNEKITSIFEGLRNEDYLARLRAFDNYIGLSGEGVVSDFVEIFVREIVPELSASDEPTQLEALAYMLRRIGEFSLSLANPSSLAGFIESALSLTAHSSSRVASMAVNSLGSLFQAMPDELSHERQAILNRHLNSDRLRLEVITAWGKIASVAPEKAIGVSAQIFDFLRNHNPEVRNAALGYFQTLGKRMKAECAFALPVLREIRDNDPDCFVRERAGAAIQSIS